MNSYCLSFKRDTENINPKRLMMLSKCAICDNHKDLLNRTRADKILGDKAHTIASNPQYDGYQRGLASMVYKFFDSKVASPDKETVGSGVNENIKLANELHEPIIRNFNKRKVYSSFKDNIWGVDLADMQ